MCYSVFILISALCVFFAAFSSPFFRYSTNSDSNVYFSVARAMQNGLLPYRDVFDHKGVFLYLIYYVAVWMTPTNMNGVYILLTISSAVTMLYGFRLARLFLPSIPAMISALSIILFSIGSPVYENGGGWFGTKYIFTAKLCFQEWNDFRALSSVEYFVRSYCGSSTLHLLYCLYPI